MLERAKAAGVSRIVAIGASDAEKANEPTLEIAQAHAEVFASVGVHPHDARLVDEAVLARIRAQAGRPKVVGIGETGLDYHYDHSAREAQVEVFRRFVRLAKELGLPVVVHSREAEDDTLRVLEEEHAEEVGGVMHCFGGSKKLAEGALALGFYVSFSGVLTFKNAEALREIARTVPRDRVMVETDCPFLAPIPMRGRRNEPAFVAHTAKKLAEVWGVEELEARRVTSENAARLFRLPP